MKIVEVNINDIKPYDNNPRINDNAIDKVAESIKQFGFKQPIVLDRDNIVVAGHTRLKAGKKLNLSTVPCLYADDLDDEQIKAYRLADNKTAEFSDWDMDKLNLELEELQNYDFGMSDFGFDEIKEDKEVEEDNFNIDEAIEDIEEQKTKLGNIYKLGNHRLMCGDSTNEKDLKKLIDGNKIDMVFTDPPYRLTGGGSTSNFGSGYMKTYKDKKREKLFEVPNFEDWIIHLKKILSENSEIFIMVNNRNLNPMIKELEKHNAKMHNILIMIKDQGFPHKWYTAKHEFILYYYFGKAMDPKRKMQSSIFEVTMPKADDKFHVSQKPISMIASILQNHIHENVLDLFGGSGSTLIACEQTNRNCYMMELDEKYCDVIIKRWEEYTGKKAELINENS
jgi:site-specific DNA-methyltransferase (adenine-specific)